MKFDRQAHVAVERKNVFKRGRSPPISLQNSHTSLTTKDFSSPLTLYIAHSTIDMGKISQLATKLFGIIKDLPVNAELITCYDCWHLVERGQRCPHCGLQN